VRPALLFLTLVAPATAADPPPRVTVELSPKDGAWVGQRVTLAVTLSTPDLFAGVPSFDIPPIPGVVVVPPAGSPTIGTETAGGDTFTTQRHEFAVYAQRPGVVRIPAFPVRFETNAGFGKPTVRREVTTREASFTAKSPPGAEGLGTVIAARELKVTDEWEPEPKSPKVGDAFTRTLAVTAAEVPGMVFPPLRVDAVEGLAAYPKQPTVEDRTDRGTLTGRRVEAVTYVCEKPATVTVADRTLTWFDLDAEELKTVQLPGRTFAVEPTPNASPEAATAPPAPARGQARWWWAFAAGGCVVALGGFVLTRVWPWWKQARADRAQSEAAYFARFRHACHRSDPHGVYVALLAWLDRLGPMTVEEFTTRADDPVLTEAVDLLRDRVYTRPDPAAPAAWSAHPLLERVEVARRLRHPAAGLTAVNPLPPLNPDG
jgi:hypothetical protein